MEKKLLKPKNEIVFQSLFSKENEEITKNFVQSLLGKKIKKIEINNHKELFRQMPEDKLGILDLQVDIDDEEKIDVEIQLLDNHNLVERLLYYFAKLYASTIKIGGKYQEGKRVVLIAILDYDLELTKFIEEMQTQWMLRETKNPEIILMNKLEIDIIELRKVKKEYEKDKHNERAQWMLFLDDPNSEEVQEIMEENKEINDAVFVVHEMTEDEKMERLAFLREKAILDEQSMHYHGLQEGIKQGERSKTLEIAKKLKVKKIPIEIIIETTGLTKEEIEML